LPDVVIIGLGHVGLPLARRACEAGLSVAGYDTSDEVVAALNAGVAHIEDVPGEAVADMLSAGFTAVTDPAVIGAADTVVICVPTGLDDRGDPDLEPVRAASRAVAGRLRPGMLVVLESTSFPGTTEEVVRPLLESGSGLCVGIDVHLAFSPERIDPGNSVYGVRNTPKVVGGCTPLCTRYAVAFYNRFVDAVVVARGTREAEMAKLLENTYRYVNIALVDEVALYCERTSIDVWDVLQCAATKPFGYAAFRPGPGIGGHCIPIDPRYLAAKAEQEGHTFHLLAAAQQVHARMPQSVADRVADLLVRDGVPVRGARVVLLGVAYKADVADTRHTPAEPIVRALRDRGARVSYHDPHVTSFDVDGVPVPALDFTTALADADLAVLLQEHSCFDLTGLATAGCLVLDTRGRLPDVAGRPRPQWASPAARRLRRWLRRWDADGDGTLVREDFDREARRVAAEFGHGPAVPQFRALRGVLLALFDDLARWAGTGDRISEIEFLAEDLVRAGGETAADRLLRPVVEAVVGLADGAPIGSGQFVACLVDMGVEHTDALSAFARTRPGTAPVPVSGRRTEVPEGVAGGRSFTGSADDETEALL
jgi:UDP-N-acetyl-D-glucosamine dehydrogenase